MDRCGQGKELLTRPHNVFRYSGETGAAPKFDAAPQAKATLAKRSMRRAAPSAVPSDAKLVLTDLAVNTSATGNYVNVDGRFRCTAAAGLKGIEATVSFEDRDGTLVRMEHVYCSPRELSSGDIGTIAVMAQSDSRYSQVKISFKDATRAIPWFDQSGMSAHE
jgi:hypothetical protein